MRPVDSPAHNFVKDFIGRPWTELPIFGILGAVVVDDPKNRSKGVGAALNGYQRAERIGEAKRKLRVVDFREVLGTSAHFTSWKFTSK